MGQYEIDMDQLAVGDPNIVEDQDGCVWLSLDSGGHYYQLLEEGGVVFIDDDAVIDGATLEVEDEPAAPADAPDEAAFREHLERVAQQYEVEEDEVLQLAEQSDFDLDLAARSAQAGAQALDGALDRASQNAGSWRELDTVTKEFAADQATRAARSHEPGASRNHSSLGDAVDDFGHELKARNSLNRSADGIVELLEEGE